MVKQMIPWFGHNMGNETVLGDGGPHKRAVWANVVSVKQRVARAVPKSV